MVEAKRIHGKVPPNNLDAEAAVLSACMLDPGTIDLAIDVLSADDLYSVANQTIFRAISDLHSSGQAVDALLVARCLEANKQLMAVGGKRYLAQLIDATPAIAHLESHCNLVSDLARQREVLATAHAIVAEGYSAHSDVGEWIGSAESRMLAATSDRKSSNGSPIRDVMTEVWQGISGEESAGELVETGFADIDAHSGGMYRGDLIIVAGRPGMGKSVLVQNIANNVGFQGNHVLFFSLEMGKGQVGQRAVAQLSGVQLQRIRNPRRHPFDDQHKEHKRVTRAIHDLSAIPITIDDTPALQLNELRSRARRAESNARKTGGRLGLVVVDYLQLMGSIKGIRSREEEVSTFSRGLKALAKEIQCPVMACAQLNRTVESRPDKRPRLSDLRESGAVEQDADQVWGVFRESYYSSSADPKAAEVIILKNRNGGDTGTVDIGWHGWCTRFVDWAKR